MFYCCEKLQYLDLSNFDTSKVTTITLMFYGCKSLIYLNLKSFKLSGKVGKTQTFLYISSNVTYCVEDQSTKII